MNVLAQCHQQLTPIFPCRMDKSLETVPHLAGKLSQSARRAAPAIWSCGADRPECARPRFTGGDDEGLYHKGGLEKGMAILRTVHVVLRPHLTDPIDRLLPCEQRHGRRHERLQPLQPDRPKEARAGETTDSEVLLCQKHPRPGAAHGQGPQPPLSTAADQVHRRPQQGQDMRSW